MHAVAALVCPCVSLISSRGRVTRVGGGAWWCCLVSVFVVIGDALLRDGSSPSWVEVAGDGVGNGCGLGGVFVCARNKHGGERQPEKPPEEHRPAEHYKSSRRVIEESVIEDCGV
mmetsp:Transcript_4099/g.7878  ORF Transcript_4099/g.7878 Transcript_4099/m.7878 type:complete len:115 (-) Transcript_4099:1474-1818(-)